jgi:hypothetical protein
MAVDGIPGFAVQTFSVFCTLRSPLLLTTLAPLDFAGLAPGGSAGVFRLDASGAHRSEAAGGPLLVKGRPRPAVIRLTGPARTGYVIILPAEAFLRGPGGTMRMHDFTCTVPRTGMLPEAGLTFQVGAGLDVAAEQAPGIYQGIFTVTVAYP